MNRSSNFAQGCNLERSGRIQTYINNVCLALCVSEGSSSTNFASAPEHRLDFQTNVQDTMQLENAMFSGAKQIKYKNEALSLVLWIMKIRI